MKNNSNKILIGIVAFLSVILVSLIVVFALTLKGVITKETFGIGKEEPAATAVPSATEAPTEATTEPTKKIVVLDPGHGKDSGSMTDEEKTAEGWVRSSRGWGEWRHWKSGTVWQDCEGSGCSGRAPSGGGCWYPIGDGDRSGEPEINLRNTEYAKAFLEQMGYEVRMTRETNEQNPSMTKRLTYCYKDGDTAAAPDADVFVCVHSNAGGGRGSAYMALSGLYDQAGTLPPVDYVEQSNLLGSLINGRITAETSMSAFGGGRYDGLPEAILFCKSPVPIAYLEIGFFDSTADMEILNSEAEAIGRAIAEGVDDYFKSVGQ